MSVFDPHREDYVCKVNGVKNFYKIKGFILTEDEFNAAKKIEKCIYDYKMKKSYIQEKNVRNWIVLTKLENRIQQNTSKALSKK